MCGQYGLELVSDTACLDEVCNVFLSSGLLSTAQR